MCQPRAQSALNFSITAKSTHLNIGTGLLRYKMLESGFGVEDVGQSVADHRGGCGDHVI